MKPPPLFVAAFGVVTLASTLTAADAPKIPRFSVGYMDTSVDPRADFAHYAWGNWNKTTPVPADKSSWGAFNELDQYNQNGLKGILERTASKVHEPGSVEQKVGDFYASALDTKAIDAAGLKPIAADLAQVAAIATPADLARTVAELHNRQITALFNITVGADEKNSAMNALQAAQGGLSLPSRDYYYGEKFEKFRTAFVEHVTKMFVLAGDAPDVAAAGARTVFETEKALAEKASTPVELRDPIANYNKMPTADLVARVPAFSFATYFSTRGIGGPAAAEIIVGQPKFYAGLQAQLTARPLGDWKTYLRYRVLRSAAPYLATPFEEERFRFYSTVLRGTPAMEPRWQRAARTVDSQIGEALGQLYVAQYYPAEAKARMDTMIQNITAVMRDRIEKLEWMTPETKKKALAKFDRFYPHGFDDQGRQYDGDGNLTDWWTEADAKEFTARAQKMVDQFNSYEVLPGVKVNGELTLGENIADLGGITLAYEALQRSLKGKERKKVDGLTEEQRFFISWAQVWRTNMRENALRQLVATDPHSPGQIRAIGPLVNFQPFYDAFGIKEGDPMWVPPEKRTKIW